MFTPVAEKKHFDKHGCEKSIVSCSELSLWQTILYDEELIHLELINSTIEQLLEFVIKPYPTIH